MLKIVREGEGKDIKWEALRGDEPLLTGSLIDLGDGKQLVFSDKDGNFLENAATEKSAVAVARGGGSGSLTGIIKNLEGIIFNTDDNADDKNYTGSDDNSEKESILSDVEYELEFEPETVPDATRTIEVINKIAKEVIKDIRDASITPTTFYSRTYFEDFNIDDAILKNGRLAQALNDLNQLVEGTFLPICDNLRQYQVLIRYNDYLSKYKAFIEVYGKEGAMFVEEYKGTGGGVVYHFGINTLMTSYSDFSKSIETNSKNSKKSSGEQSQGGGSAHGSKKSMIQRNQSMESSQRSIKEAAPQDNQSMEGSQRSGKSAAPQGNQSADNGNSIFLHPLEGLLIRKAVAYLELESSSTKSVLVDIFERNKSGDIQWENNECKTHTIVLYMQTVNSEKQLIVIDPTKSDHSKYLGLESVNSIKIFGSDIKNAPKIVIPQSEIYKEIYNRPANTPDPGPEASQYRDCVDIAVKIAFGLKSLKEPIIKLDKLAELTVIQEITNKGFTNDVGKEVKAKASADKGKEVTINDMSKEAKVNVGEVIKKLSEIPARIKQATSDDIRHKIGALIVKIEDQIKYARKYDGDDAAKIIERARLDVFAKQYDSGDYERSVKDLLAVYQKNEESFLAEFYSANCTGCGNVHEILLGGSDAGSSDNG